MKKVFYTLIFVFLTSNAFGATATIYGIPLGCNVCVPPTEVWDIETETGTVRIYATEPSESGWFDLLRVAFAEDIILVYEINLADQNWELVSLEIQESPLLSLTAAELSEISSFLMGALSFGFFAAGMKQIIN